MKKRRIFSEAVFLLCAAPVFLAASIFVAVFALIFIPLGIALLLIGVVLDHFFGLDLFDPEFDKPH